MRCRFCKRKTKSSDLGRRGGSRPTPATGRGLQENPHWAGGRRGGLTLRSRLHNSFPFLREARVPTNHNLFACVGAFYIQINRVKQQCAQPERAPGTRL